MAEDKKKKMAVFAQEKNSFIGEIPKEGKNGKKKKSVAYQPRDADTTSGQNVQRSESTVKYQKTDTSGQNVQKSEGAEAGDKSGSDFIQPDGTFTEETEENAERTEDAASNGSTYTAEQYMQYDQFVEPLRTSQILQQDFSPEQPPAFGNHVWYGLTVYGFDPTLNAYAGQDGNGHFAAETIEGLIMEHFDVTPEQIRADNDAYSEEFGTYIEPQGLGGYTPDFGISGADREGNTLVLVLDQYTDQNKIFHTSVLTIQLESEDTTETEDAEETEETTGVGEDTFTTWKYLSNQTIYDNQAAWE